jgi:hypothetical protein
MNVSIEPTVHKPGSSATRTTTLYDLMSEINAATCGPELADIMCDIQETAGNNRNSPVVEKVRQMFESGQIRFMDIKNIKREYADWFI